MNFGEKASKSLGFKALKNDGFRSDEIKYIPLNQICCRYQNKYISDVDKTKVLMKSIADNGLIEPIVIIDIDNYLKNVNMNKDERNYLQDKLNNGFKYFISSGHRRYKASCSNVINKVINTDDELDDFYKEYKDIFESDKKKVEKSFLDGNPIENDSKLYIACNILENDFSELNEASIYNESNTTQREITGFEITVNMIDELKRLNLWNNAIQNIRIKRINEMSERSLKDKAKQLNLPSDMSIGDIRSALINDHQTSYISGFEGELNKYIADYIESNTKRIISISNIKQTRMIIERFDKRIIDCIFAGQISFKDCKALLAVYNDVDVEDLLYKIKSGKFNVEDYLVKKERKSEVLRKNDVLSILYDLKLGKISINDAILKVEEG